MILEYDPKTGNKIKTTTYHPDGVRIHSIIEYDPQTGIKIKDFSFQKDGKTIWDIYEFDPKTGKFLKTHTQSSKLVKTEQKNINNQIKGE
ncbi:hypothetical protein PSSA1_v1c5420 [Candidatus Phytoplasma solani]|uniref:DUF2963 domain-containing protein n=1 Tax=Candidatus Phytoplasma solani TaxID=69896 RepID=A0A421NUS5_9MOLU|nr:hypothetical protein PSSA1_v1c5420 [Candidatus Phytoplasma solani]